MSRCCGFGGKENHSRIGGSNLLRWQVVICEERWGCGGREKKFNCPKRCIRGLDGGGQSAQEKGWSAIGFLKAGDINPERIIPSGGGYMYSLVTKSVAIQPLM